MLAVCPKCEHYETCEQNYRWDSCACINYKALPTKNPTHADRIRAKNDEELADLFDTWIRDCDSNDVPCRTFCLQGCSNCEKNWLRWLKQKAEDGE